MGRTRRTMRRTSRAFFPKGRYVVSATSAPSRKYGIGTQASSSMAAMVLCSALFSLTVTEKRTSARRQASTTVPL